MPKLFPIHIEVEELALGRVMRQLNGMSGVAKMHLDLETPKGKRSFNGSGEERVPRGPYKTRKKSVQLDETGEEAVAKALLGKPPMTRKHLMDAFQAQGRAPSSVNSVLHKMRQQEEIKLEDGHYSLTKKVRDRLRHRKAAKKSK